MLGVCKALKAMHQYRVKGGQDTVQGQRMAQNADAAVEGETRGNRERIQDNDDSEQNEPLMEGEVSRSQDGVAPGDVRAYAHRDIKPGI